MGRFLGGIFGNTQAATAGAPSLSGVFDLNGQYYMKQEGGWGTVTVDYLVIGGGGGGGRGRGGGGGAGGYRTNYASETPGGPGTSTEVDFGISLSTNYPVQIGAGGLGGPGSDKRGYQGGASIFHTITSIGGGAGSAAYQPTSRTTEPGTYEGGSGGGGAGQVNPPATNMGHGGAAVSPPSYVVQGYNGGDATPDLGNDGTGGGGAGGTGTPGQGGSGGVGKSSSITGSAVFRGGGGGGGGDDASGAGGNGGGAGAVNSSATPGTHATGGGGGGAKYNQPQARGGTGVVILRYVNTLTIANPGGGLTLSTAPDGGYSVTTITHPSNSATTPGPGNATGNVSWS